MQIFEKINKETGWRIGFVYKELKEKWGWAEEPSPEQYAQTHTAAQQEKERQEQQQQQMQQAHAAQQQHMQQQSMQLQQGFIFNSQNMSQNMSLPAVQLTPPHQNMTQTPQHQQQQQQHQQQKPPGGAGKQNKRMPSGILNPMYAKADFNLPQHPYQDVYVAPSSGYGHPQGGVWWGS